MATTPNYGWVTPAPTDFVTDLPADFETFADAADATVKALNPGTTAGDLDYYTSGTAKSRLAIGTAGQVLKVNAGATAPEWGSVSSASPSWNLLNAGGTALTGASTITVSGISNQKNLMILIDAASSTNATCTVSVRFNTDSGANYTLYGHLRRVNTAYSKDDFFVLNNYSTNDAIPVGRGGSAQQALISGSVTLFGSDSSGWKNYIVTGTGNATGGGENILVYTGQGIWESTGSVTSVSVITSTGDFDAGTLYVMGAS